MKASELLKMLNDGVRPTVKLTDKLWDDSWGDSGMIATITSFYTRDEGDYVFMWLTFDYNKQKEHNLSLQSHSYYIYTNGTNSGMGTAFEAGAMKLDNITEESCFELSPTDQELPFNIANVFVDLYVKSGSKDSYVQWLEDSLRESNMFYKDVSNKGAR